MDPRIQEFLARRLYEDTRDIQALGELRNDVDKLENYLRMYILQEVKGEKESAEKKKQENQASQDEKVDWTRMTQQYPDTSESATGRGRGWSTQMYTPMNQASQSEGVGGNRMSLAAKHVLESTTGRGREWSTQMYTPMNQASQSEDVGGNRMSLAAKHVLESMNQGKVRYAVTQMQSPMDQQTEAEVNRLLYSILMLEQSYDEARKKHANCEEVQSKLDELNKLEKYLRNIKGADPQGLYKVKSRLKEILDHAKKISQAAEKTNVSAQIYTPMQQASQAEGVDWNRMTQVTQMASESDNSRNNPGASMWRYVEEEMRPIPSEQEDIPAPNRRHNSPSSPPMHSWSSNSRNSYPDAETLMNAVLNSEQIRGELHASSPHHQGPPHIPETEERRNARRCSRSSHQEETRQAQGYMQSPMVQSVLNTGVDRDRVRNVIERRLRDRGNTYPNAEALMNAVLNYEQNREELNTSSSHHQGPSQNPQTDERRNGRRRSRSSTSSNAFPNAEAPVNTVMNSGQNREVLNTSSSHDQKPPVTPQNAPQSYSPSTESRNSSFRNPDLEQVVNELRQKTKCKVCLDSELEVMFQPCNHLCCCRSCGFDERLKTCPVCRSPIENRVRTLIP